MKQSPNTMIKCAFSNDVHALFNSLLDEKEKVASYQTKAWRLERKISNMSDAEKVKLLNEIVKLHQESSNMIGKYRSEKRLKKRVKKARIERGYVPKKKTRKEDYLKSANAA